MNLSNFLTDVSAGFQNAAGAFSPTGPQQHLTPNALPIMQTPYGTAAGVTLSTQAPMLGVNPALMHQQMMTPPPMPPPMSTVPPLFANPMQYQNPVWANYMAGNTMTAMPSASYMTAPSMGTYRQTPPQGIGSTTMTRYRTGGFNDLATTMMGPYWGMESGLRGMPLGYDPMQSGAASATNVVNRAFSVAQGATTFGMSFGGALAGDLIGGGAGMAIGAGMATSMGAAAGGTLAGIAGFGGMLVGSTVGMGAGLALARYNPFSAMMNRREDALRYQSASRGIVTTGNQLDITGTGFSQRGAVDLMQGMYGAAAESSLFNRQDFAKISQFSMDSGLVNMANTPEQVLRTVKDVAKTVKIFMSVAGDPDLQSAISRMGDLYRGGIGIPRLVEAQSNIRQFARMAGVSVDEAMSTYGAQGGYIFKTAGLTQGLGMQMGVAGAGVANALVQGGAFSQADINRMGGVAGIGQSLTQASAGFLGGGINMALPGLLRESGGGRLGINPQAVQSYLRGQSTFFDLAANQSVLGGPNAMGNVQYMYNNTSRLQTELGEQLGPQGNIAAMLRAMQDMQQVMPGVSTQTIATFLTGGDKDAALALSELSQSPTALRSMMQESSRERRRTGGIERARWMEENTAWQRNVARPMRRFKTELGADVFGGFQGQFADIEDRLRAQSAGMDIRANYTYGLTGPLEDLGGPLGGVEPLNQRSRWWHLQGAADVAMQRAEGLEGITRFGVGAGRRLLSQTAAGFGPEVSYLPRGATSRQAYREDLAKSAALIGNDLTSDQAQELLQRLTVTSASAGQNVQALELFREYASKRGKDNAATRLDGYKRYLADQGISVDASTLSQLYQAGSILYQYDENVSRSLENTVLSSGALEGLGDKGLTKGGIKDLLGVSSRKDVDRLRMVQIFAEQQGLGYDAKSTELLDLLGRFARKQIYGTEEEVGELAMQIGQAGGMEVLTALRKSPETMRSFGMLGAKYGTVGGFRAERKDQMTVFAWDRLASALSEQGMDVSKLRESPTLSTLRSVTGFKGSDKQLREWAGSQIQGAGPYSIVGGMSKPKTELESAIEGTLASFAVSSRTFDTATKRFEDAVGLLYSRAEEIK